MNLRLVIADDHALFRQGIKSLLRLQSGVDIVAEVEHADDLAAVIDSTPCDILLLDLQMDRWSANDIEWLAPKVKVVVLTASERSEDALEAIQLGARAVVHKRFAIETLMAAVRAVAEGHVWMPPSLQADVTREWTATAPRLTPREREIVRLVGKGLRNAEIAKRLFINEVTVKTHLNNIFQKLAVRDRVELALYAIRVGLASVHTEPR